MVAGAATSRDIVVVGTHPFVPGVPLGDWHLARALAKRHRVLWVDPPASPMAPRRGVASSAMFTSRPQPSDAGVLVGSPIAPSGRFGPKQATLVDPLFTAQVNRWARKLSMTDVDVVSFAPRAGPLHGLRRRRLAAWLKDRDWASDDVRHAAWLRRRQEDLVRHADVVTAVSDVLVADCRAVGVEATHIPNGCDAGHFAAARPEPAEMRGLARPRVVFAGAWNWRVDSELVANVASRLPHCSFVLVGAATSAVPPATNVHAIGAVGYDELPGYLQAGDVGIVPYRADDFNAASCPLKIYEYLAAGLPVVASHVDVNDVPGQLVRRADHVDGFVQAIEQLAGHELGDACRAEARGYSWDVRAESLLDALDAIPIRSSSGAMS